MPNSKIPRFVPVTFQCPADDYEILKRMSFDFSVSISDLVRCVVSAMAANYPSSTGE